MRANGNGDVRVCVSNLLRIWRGEVPYERVKGLDPTLIDKPTSTVIPEAREDVRWLIETYEPRALLESVSVVQDSSVEGNLLITAKLKGEGEVTNG